MTTTEVHINVFATVEITNDAGEAAIERYVNLSPEQAGEIDFRPGLTRDDLLTGLAQACLLTGSDPEGVDGWADLSPGDINIWFEMTRG